MAKTKRRTSKRRGGSWSRSLVDRGLSYASSAADAARAAANDPNNIARLNNLKGQAAAYGNRALDAIDSGVSGASQMYQQNVSPERRAQIANFGNRAQQKAACIRRCSLGRGGRRKRKSKTRKMRRY